MALTHNLVFIMAVTPGNMAVLSYQAVKVEHASAKWVLSHGGSWPAMLSQKNTEAEYSEIDNWDGKD